MFRFTITLISQFPWFPTCEYRSNWVMHTLLIGHVIHATAAAHLTKHDWFWKKKENKTSTETADCSIAYPPDGCSSHINKSTTIYNIYHQYWPSPLISLVSVLSTHFTTIIMSQASSLRTYFNLACPLYHNALWLICLHSPKIIIFIYWPSLACTITYILVTATGSSFYQHITSQYHILYPTCQYHSLIVFIKHKTGTASQYYITCIFLL